MARKRGTPGDIDQLRQALRPRMLLQSGGGGGSSLPTTIPPHTHHASEIIAEPEETSALLSGDDVQEDLEELGIEKLARSGEQPWLGPAALDMNHHSIDNADDVEVEGTATVRENVTLTGATGLAKVTGARELTFVADASGEAEVNNARQIHLVGDDDDGEARIDGAERIVFNDEPTKSVIENPSRVELNTGVEAGVSYTAAEGIVSWDSLEDTLIANVASGSGVVAVALGWEVVKAVCGWSPV